MKRAIKKRLYFDMLCWARSHNRLWPLVGLSTVVMSTRPGKKPALNNGSDLFSEDPVIGIFPSFVSRKLRKILAY